MDRLTFFFLLFNFAIVGTIAIFYAKGIPMVITQSYLVATSAILAWQLSFFNDWTMWTFLVLLALYDLCAVLTPCGPLKALVKLMQRDDAPAMPGLLYEARLPGGVQRPARSNASRENSNGNQGNHGSTSNGGTAINRCENGESASAEELGPRRTRQSRNEVEQVSDSSNDNRGRNTHCGHTSINANAFTSNVHESDMPNSASATASISTPMATTVTPYSTLHQEDHSAGGHVTGIVPFAICKIYKLQIVTQDCPPFIREKYYPYLRSQLSRADASGEQRNKPTFTPQELLANVTVLFPKYGGRILVEGPEEGQGDGATSGWRRRDDSGNLPRYIVLDRSGAEKRVLVMNEAGRVFEEVKGAREHNDADDEGAANNSIKLGLGDFIFYSVLVSKAAMNSFTTFAACMLVVLAGLGGTLILLSVYHAALPALPISIFLGVIFYFATRALIEPWVETILEVPFYV
mmetsp:Transcript_13115/g.19113  ORF Transcript_13115/g.19113 Transcript_13115/m.19113 type:complete len:463 (+) Transcript_13115:2-1390(+)